MELWSFVFSIEVKAILPTVERNDPIPTDFLANMYMTLHSNAKAPEILVQKIEGSLFNGEGIHLGVYVTIKKSMHVNKKNCP